MFLDLQNSGPRPEPLPPRPSPRLTPRRERMIGWIIGFNLAMLLVGPLAGGTILEAVLLVIRR